MLLGYSLTRSPLHRPGSADKSLLVIVYDCATHSSCWGAPSILATATRRLPNFSAPTDNLSPGLGIWAWQIWVIQRRRLFEHWSFVVHLGRLRDEEDRRSMNQMELAAFHCDVGPQLLGVTPEKKLWHDWLRLQLCLHSCISLRPTRCSISASPVPVVAGSSSCAP